MMAKDLKIPFIALLGIFFSFTRVTFGQQPPLNIAISWERLPESFRYSIWLSEADSNLNFIVLFDHEMEEIPAILDTCDALLLTGGNDIYPAWYGTEADTARCGFFNKRRDSVEMMALETAFSENLPVMGICRGMQLINVHLGGTLYVDLPEDIGSETLHRGEGDGWKQHLVYPDREFFPLEGFSAQPQFVATNHHQGVDRLADGLRVIARSSDSLPEAIQWRDSTKSFLLAVQWHPEWKPLAGEMASPIAKYFLKAAAEFQSKR